MLTHAQIQQFKIDGYLVLPQMFGAERIAKLRKLTQQHLDQRQTPFELEAEVKYPGAPASVEAMGGNTIRRLRMAFQRHEDYRQTALEPQIVDAVRQILGGKRLLLNPNHHNCIMTKLPEFSSVTHWHRDTRYWNFNNKYLINAWVALGDETEQNGCMSILPGSHRWEVRPQALDDAQFLIPDHPDNEWRLSTSRLVELHAGDVLLFSAHCFHAAGKNSTKKPKFSMVFTYHNESTCAISGSNSAATPAIELAA